MWFLTKDQNAFYGPFQKHIIAQTQRKAYQITRHSGQFQVTVFSLFCYVLLCNRECPLPEP